jgi:hypothetical protein
MGKPQLQTRASEEEVAKFTAIATEQSRSVASLLLHLVRETIDKHPSARQKKRSK